MIEYYQTDSLVHRAPPLVKFFGILLVMIISISFVDLTIQIVLLALVLAVFTIARLPLKPVVKFSVPFLILAVFVLLLQVFTYPGGTSFSFFGLSLSKEGMVFGFILALRLVVISISVPILLMTTKPSALAKSLQPFLPGFLVLSLILTFRLIPMFQDEFIRIKAAQESRGAKLGVKKLHYFLAPLFFKAFERATSMSWSLESRGFRV